MLTSTRWPSVPLDCMGCGVCVKALPRRRACHGGRRGRARSAGGVRLLRQRRCRQAASIERHHAASGSQFSQPLLEFSGACAGCAETAYARLVTQLFGDRMYIANATGCSSIWGGPAATSRRIHGQQARAMARRGRTVAVRGQRRARHGHAAWLRGREQHAGR